MAERVLNNDLSGDEICVAAGEMLTQVLRTDCRLKPANAYHSFRLHIRGVLIAEDVGHTPEVAIDHVFRSTDAVIEDAMAEEFDVEMLPMPPNQVRVESGQAVPVETRDVDGRSVTKGVKYARRSKTKA